MCHSAPYHTIPHYTVWHHSVLYYTSPYHTTPHCTILSHTVPYHTRPYHTTPSGTMLYHTTHTRPITANTSGFALYWMVIKVVFKIMDVCTVHTAAANLQLNSWWVYLESDLCVCAVVAIIHISSAFSMCHQSAINYDSVWKYELTQYANSCTYMICMWDRPDVKCIALDKMFAHCWVQYSHTTASFDTVQCLQTPLQTCNLEGELILPSSSKTYFDPEIQQPHQHVNSCILHSCIVHQAWSYFK
jgi:hypothetical protein